MVEIQHLCKRFGDKILFNDLNIHVKQHEFVCLAGASGRGKTTILNMIGHIESPTSGKVLINGDEIVSKRERLNFFRNTVGFVFQNFALVEEKTVEQNLNLVHPRYRNKTTIAEALEMVGLSAKIKSKVYTLSGGEQQRVALARLFIKPCDLILADEPTGSLDKNNAERVWDILNLLNKNGKTVIVVSHDEFIQKNSRRLIEL